MFERKNKLDWNLSERSDAWEWIESWTSSKIEEMPSKNIKKLTLAHEITQL